MDDNVEEDFDEVFSSAPHKAVSTTSLLFRILVLILAIVALTYAGRDFNRKYKGIEVHSLKECLDHNPPEECESVGNKWFE